MTTTKTQHCCHNEALLLRHLLKLLLRQLLQLLRQVLNYKLILIQWPLTTGNSGHLAGYQVLTAIPNIGDRCRFCCDCECECYN